MIKGKVMVMILIERYLCESLEVGKDVRLVNETAI